MVGLSIVLEAQKSVSKTPQVINKVTMIKPSPPPSPTPSTRSFSCRNSRSTFPAVDFLDRCFLCKQKLSPGKDIYMYKGDRGFCSVECRCRQIFMDEEENVKVQNCSFAAIKVKATTASTPSSSSPASRNGKGTRARAGGFAY